MTGRTEVPEHFRAQARPMSDKQAQFIRDLLESKDLSDEERTAAYEQLDNGLSMRKASSWIDRLLLKPQRTDKKSDDKIREKVADVPSPEQIEAGRYAIPSPRCPKGGSHAWPRTPGRDGISCLKCGSVNDLAFYRVWRGTRNPNYVKVYLLHGPDSTEMSFAAGVTVLKDIIKHGVREAALTYGREIGACSRCGKRLTNRVSRELAIGPVCGGRMFGGGFREEVRTAREAILARGEDPDEVIE